jgi:hypothetical protein
MSQEEIDDAREQGCIVGVCETRRRWTFDSDACERGERCREDSVYFCVVIPLPDNPCDVDFMKEISS